MGCVCTTNGREIMEHFDEYFFNVMDQLDTESCWKNALVNVDLDSIPFVALKDCIIRLSEPLTKLFNRSRATWIIPNFF